MVVSVIAGGNGIHPGTDIILIMVMTGELITTQCIMVGGINPYVLIILNRLAEEFITVISDHIAITLIITAQVTAVVMSDRAHAPGHPMSWLQT